MRAPKSDTCHEMPITRRDFLSTSTAIAVGPGTNAFSEIPETQQTHPIKYKPPQRPVIVTRETGDNTIPEPAE
jgi:hypothetical protein